MSLSRSVGSARSLLIALAIAGLISRDHQIVRAAYFSLEFIGWFVIVPLSLAALLSGLIQSLGTQWGLFRYHWVLAKFLLTSGATIVLLVHMQAVSRMADVAADAVLSSGDFRALRIQLVIHAAGGLLVLLAVTSLSVYQPWGLTPYRRRHQHERKALQPDLLGYPDASVPPDRGFTTTAPRWVYVIGIHAIGVALLFVILHLTGVGLRVH